MDLLSSPHAQMSLFLQANLLSRPHAKIPLSLFSLSLASKIFTSSLFLSFYFHSSLSFSPLFLCSPLLSSEAAGSVPLPLEQAWRARASRDGICDGSDVPHVEGDGDRPQPDPVEVETPPVGAAVLRRDRVDRRGGGVRRRGGLCCCSGGVLWEVWRCGNRRQRQRSVGVGF